MAGFMRREGVKEAHKGFLWGMYVRADLRDVRDAGVGLRLAEVVIVFARERVELLQLAVVNGNVPARILCASVGFVEYGTERKAFEAQRPLL